MSKESLLKKEFKESDINRIRNLIGKKFNDNTKIQIGYSNNEIRNEGDEWVDKNGKKWIFKDNIKQSISKFDSIKKINRLPLKCPSCNQHISLTKLNIKMYYIHKICSNCVFEMETKLKIDGKYEEYEKNLMNLNKNNYLDDFEKIINSYYNKDKETFVTESGEIENWSSGNINESILDDIKKEITDIKNKEF